MRDILLRKFNIENPEENSEFTVAGEDWNEVLFNGAKEKLRRRKNRIKLDGQYTKTEEKLLSRYRNGGDGFIEWCEDNVCLAIYHEGASVPKWTPMSQLPEDKHPDTGRSYKDMWEKQKPILREALEMKNGRFLYTLVVFCWPRGDGKCLDLLTKVMMYDGTIKFAKDVKIGDLLMGDDNEPRKVLKLVHGNEELFEVIPRRGESFTVTGDHQLTLKRRTKIRKRNGVSRRDPGHGEIIDITVNGFQKKSKTFKKEHMLFRVPVDWKEQPVPLDPYFLGLWLGEGNSNHPTITTMDKEVVDYIRMFSDENGLFVSEKEKSGNKALTYSLVTAAGQKNNLLDKMREIGVIGNKHIPHVYKANSREIRMQILAGILDADGYRNRNSFEITLKREHLAEDVAFIARSLGYHACVKKVSKGIKGTGFIGEYFRVGISGDCSQIPVRVERRKCEKRSDWKDVLVSNIKEIRSVGNKDYVGFMVDGNNRFLLGDFTVTHNSLIACLIQLWKFFCFARQQIMLGANSKDQVKFVHYDIMKDIILNSPNLVKVLGKKNIQEKEIRLLDSKKRVMSIIRSISSFSGIVSNITGYTFSEIFDMKNPRFFVQLDGSIRNMPNALGVIDSTVSEKTHILYGLYQSYLKREENGDNLTYFSYRCSPEGDASDFFNPQMTQKQLNSYKNKFPPAEFARYFRNLWDTGITKLFSTAMLEAMHYVAFAGKEYVIGTTAIQDHLDKKDKLKQLLEVPKVERKYELDETKILRDVAKMYSELVPIKSIYALDDSPYFCSMATSVDLEAFTEFYDTHWCIGIGVDRADPMKEKMDGARTILTIVAKGLPGSRSNPRISLATDLVNKYIYVNLGVMHVADSSLETIKELVNNAEEEFEYIDSFCSERWGMFDIAPWLQDKGIEPEILHPSPSKQMEAFSEVYIVVRNERFKSSPISYNGSKGPDILMEEMSMFETAPEKVWYGSPEKNQTNGVQDDVVFSLGWCVYGLRFKTVDDMRPRSGKLLLGNYIANNELVGSYGG